ncbi:hypothetical protein SERLA73DRAFT_176524 [Serpula lacrymans var. lacrymans S7.3]|uniref:Uncharacterized protein n=2 Tax=Serpula lacrymans var. lacrymans TaxID=341189 RepID=F8PN41_SERL3|nr:uncharacterized protein SERLADRAFT_459410 [Serpula lacrymans var. lacrymans S7.9]EGO03023.1 hypothetical protein SERLA73DRAFT_176524 [Serpula lacrymans var. lacrymans S7.3]EGO28701.1 hypothetical protein SERLADRAFT_459410 [Serpula lacrymans var. lacrymans S7.9]
MSVASFIRRFLMEALGEAVHVYDLKDGATCPRMTIKMRKCLKGLGTRTASFKGIQVGKSYEDALISIGSP